MAGSPEEIEQRAEELMVAAYIMRDQRKSPADAHGRKHLQAAIEAGNSGRCRGLTCVLKVRHLGRRYSLDLDIPWNERDSDFRPN